MNPPSATQPDDRSNAATVAALLAIDPAGLGGVAVRARAGPQRDAWLALLRSLLPDALPLRRIPLHADDSRLLGGIDLPATLRSGMPVAQSGLLAQTNGGLAILPSAERLSPATAARLASVLDTGEVAMERNGLSMRSPACLGLVALDESATEDEHLSAALRDRLAFQISFETHAHAGAPPLRTHPQQDAASGQESKHAELACNDSVQPDAIRAARLLLPRVTADDAVLQALCESAFILGIHSPRACLLALRAARAAAALDGRIAVDGSDASVAASLVLSPRATQLPASSADDQETSQADQSPSQDDEQPAASASPDAPSDPAPQSETESSDAASPPVPAAQELNAEVLEAAKAAIPAGLLAALQLGKSQRSRVSSVGSGAQHNSTSRGRPTGARRGDLSGGARLNLIETLRAAAPWQKLRKSQACVADAQQPGSKDRAPKATANARVHVRREDFHVAKFKQRRTTTTIFVVDASGSSALHRLAEAKGAVELLLADCYARRDQVAVLAFRGKACELLLPPTRSLVRAKRSMAQLPGGGGTPLAAGLDMARTLAVACNRRGETPIIVLLTDARANVARDGSPGRDAALRDALASAGTVRAADLSALLIDTSPRAQTSAQQLADAMGARYLALPHADAQLLSHAVRTAGHSGSAALTPGTPS